MVPVNSGADCHVGRQWRSDSGAGHTELLRPPSSADGATAKPVRQRSWFCCGDLGLVEKLAAISVEPLPGYEVDLGDLAPFQQIAALAPRLGRPPKK